MKNCKNTTKACPIPVGASIARPFYEDYARNVMPTIKNTHGITLIALVITIIIL